MSSGMKKSASTSKDAKPNLDFLTSTLQFMSFDQIHACHGLACIAQWVLVCYVKVNANMWELTRAQNYSLFLYAGSTYTFYIELSLL